MENPRDSSPYLPRGGLFETLVSHDDEGNEHYSEAILRPFIPVPLSPGTSKEPESYFSASFWPAGSTDLATESHGEGEVFFGFFENPDHSIPGNL